MKKVIIIFIFCIVIIFFNFGVNVQAYDDDKISKNDIVMVNSITAWGGHVETKNKIDYAVAKNGVTFTKWSEFYDAQLTLWSATEEEHGGDTYYISGGVTYKTAAELMAGVQAQKDATRKAAEEAARNAPVTRIIDGVSVTMTAIESHEYDVKNGNIAIEDPTAPGGMEDPNRTATPTSQQIKALGEAIASGAVTRGGTVNSETFSLDDIFSSGNTFFNNSKAQENKVSFGKDLKAYISNTRGGLMQAVVVIGNFIFGVVSLILGVKYIFSGIDGKAVIKETLPTFIVGVIFFYLSTNLVYFFTNSVTNTGTAGVLDVLFGGGSSFEKIKSDIWSTINVVVNVATIGGIVIIGLKYMFSAADTKAELKKSLLPMTTGIVFVYCSFKIILFIKQVAEAALAVKT